MNLVRTVAPMLLTVLLACGGDDSKQAKAPQTTAGETTSSSTTTTTPNGMAGMNSGTSPGMTGMTGSGSGSNGSMTGSDATGSGGSMSGGSVGSTGSTGSMGAGSSTGGAMGGSATASTFNDAEIAAIVASVHTGEVEQGKAAQKKANNPKVKAFAAKMVTHHTSANTKQADLLKKLKMISSENATSRELASEGANTLSSLNAMSGADFDRSYIDAQVKEHQKALTMFDNQLIPQAQNSELKQMLQTVRSTVDSHLREAMDLQKTLAASK